MINVNEFLELSHLSFDQNIAIFEVKGADLFCDEYTFLNLSIEDAFHKYGSKQVLSFQFLALSKLALYIPSSDNVSQ